ncbi:anti-sigma factor family protein [Ruegeria sp. ANG-S4]|uniref:anti-sigma factor family protein n=1 Tax=Ruegeria sp. ANG-S4 TaxID=1577904 RepID=UPI000689517B|nr:anti-sigma factor [Ruegeria sp. ANG-S4]
MSSPKSTQELLSAYADGQLSNEDAKRVDEIVSKDPALREELNRLLRQNQMLKDAFPAPSRDRLNKLVADAKQGRSRHRPMITNVAASLALIAAGTGLGYGLASKGPMSEVHALRSEIERLSQSAMAAHALYSVEVVHPVEVSVREKDHLLGWLSNRLGAPVEAPNLSEEGYNLIGGRLLPFGAQPAAQFMYEDASGHRLTFFATVSANPRSSSFRFGSDGDLESVSWGDKSWNYTLVGDLDREALKHIALKLHGQIT